MILTLVIAVPIIVLILWASGIIPSAIEEYKEFSDAMKETRKPFGDEDEKHP
jgi:hypothetical protein